MRLWQVITEFKVSNKDTTTTSADFIVDFMCFFIADFERLFA